jgi:polyisoprenoid-binding protein YceI
MKRALSVLSAVAIAAGIFGGMRVANAANAYTADKVHSSIGFTISHMVVSRVTGGFGDYEAAIQFDPTDTANAKFDFTIKVASIDTRNDARDKHLKSADFFDAEKFSDITFKTKNVVAKGGEEYVVTGDLTMKGVTRGVELPVTVRGPVANPMGGGQILGIESHFILNRQDYGVSWNKVLDNGGVMVGNDVHADVLIEAHEKK